MPDPISPDEHYEAYYHSHSVNYDSLRLDDNEDIVATVNEIGFVTSLHSRMLLDIGCGTGRYLREFQKRGCQTVGIDASAAQIRASGNPNILLANATCLPFESLRFDICTAILMVHQNSPEQRSLIFREVFRVLKAGSPLIVKTRSHEDIGDRIFPDIFPSTVAINHQRYPDIDCLVENLQAIGFVGTKIVKLKREREMPTLDYMKSVIQKHNTTLSLIPQDELETGILILEDRLKGRATIKVPLNHTLVFAYKP